MAVGKTPLEAVDHLGVIHRMWPVTESPQSPLCPAWSGPKPLFIADGHHRYETAVKYRQEIYESGFLSKDHPANYVLMMFVAMEDPGLVVLPTHRLLPGLARHDRRTTDGEIGGLFTVTAGGPGSGTARNVWEELEIDRRTGDAGHLHPGRPALDHFRVTMPARPKMADAANDHGERWQGLGVSLLHRLIVENLLGCESGRDKYVHLVDEVMNGLATDEFPLAALVMPATVDHVRTISMQGERMPAKSTYFYPKLLSGLVINPLE